MTGQMVAYVAEKALRDAGIPVIGVSIGVTDDRSTWVAVFPAGTTDAQKAQARSILDTVVVDDAALNTAREQTRFDGEKLVKAVAIWTAQKLSIPLSTARQEIIAIYRGL